MSHRYGVRLLHRYVIKICWYMTSGGKPWHFIVAYGNCANWIELDINLELGVYGGFRSTTYPEKNHEMQLTSRTTIWNNNSETLLLCNPRLCCRKRAYHNWYIGLTDCTRRLSQKFFELTIHTLPQLKCIGLVSVLFSQLPFQSH